MPSQKEPPQDSTSSETTPPVGSIRPFEVAAVALWMYHITPKERDQKIGPEDYLEAACALLSKAEEALARKLAEDAWNRAAEERRKAGEVYEPSKEYPWREVLKRQPKGEQDEKSLAKFSPGKRWPRLKPKVESGAFRFTEKDLANRPAGLSMVGTITTEKGLRKAVKRLFPEWSAQIIKSKALALWQINTILIDQLGRNEGKIPAPRAKTAPA